MNIQNIQNIQNKNIQIIYRVSDLPPLPNLSGINGIFSCITTKYSTTILPVLTFPDNDGKESFVEKSVSRLQSFFEPYKRNYSIVDPIHFSFFYTNGADIIKIKENETIEEVNKKIKKYGSLSIVVKMVD